MFHFHTESYVVWTLVGIALLMAEMLSSAFVLIFVALGAFASAILAWYRPNEVNNQLILCSVISVLGMILLRKPIKSFFLKSPSNHTDVGVEIRSDQAVGEQQETRITYQGTQWSALNVAENRIEKGDLIRIVGIKGNTLHIEKSSKL